MSKKFIWKSFDFWWFHEFAEKVKHIADWYEERKDDYLVEQMWRELIEMYNVDLCMQKAS